MKPSEVQGHLTLKDINQRIHAPPPSRSIDKKDNNPSIIYPTSAFSGKPVVVKTKILTQGGKGSITILRTKGWAGGLLLNKISSQRMCWGITKILITKGWPHGSNSKSFFVHGMSSILCFCQFYWLICGWQLCCSWMECVNLPFAGSNFVYLGIWVKQ